LISLLASAEEDDDTDAQIVRRYVGAVLLLEALADIRAIRKSLTTKPDG
jgi:hypothetical protein